MSRGLTRAEELWIQKLMVRGEWEYCEVLAWITLRHGRTVAEALHFGASALYRDPPDVVAATCLALALDYAPVAETEPALALEVALIAGTVTAFADFPRDQHGPPWKIAAADWQHLTIRTLSRWRGTTVVVDPRRWGGLHSTSDDGVMINLRFARETVMAAFPEAGLSESSTGKLTLVSVAPPAPTGRPNVARRGHSTTSWLDLPETNEVARQRVRESGGDGDDERQVRDELIAMAAEQDWALHPPTVDTLRNRLGYKVRAD